MDIEKYTDIQRPDLDTVIFISDIHFGARASSIEWLENMEGYFNNFFIPLVKKTVSSGKKPCVVVAGDYFDNRQSIDINVMSTAIQVMKKISSECPVYMVIGNHDIYKKQDLDVTSLSIFNDFSSIHNVHICYELTKLHLANGKSLLLVSWVGDYAVENKIITKYKNEVDYIILHTELSGMTYDNNRPIVGGVNCDILDGRKLLSGHIHKRQEGKKAIYFGSPYATTRGDIGNEKGIYTLDTETNKLTFKKNDYSPKFVSVNYSDFLTKNDQERTALMSNNYVDFVMTEKESSKNNTGKLIESLGAYHAKSIELVVRKDDVAVVDENMAVSQETTSNDVFVQSLSVMDLTDEQKKLLEQMNEEYVKLAMEALN